MVAALQRSGHHAFVTWLLQSCPKHLFLNAIQNDRFMRLRFIQNNPELRFVTDMGLSAKRECEGDFTPKELIAYNTENLSISDAREIFLSPTKARRIGTSKAAYFVIFLRDPFNNLASRAMRAPPESLQEAARLWADHYTAYKMALAGNSNVPILYNRWLSDPSYRKQIADRFEISSDEMPSTETVRWGNGSSFGTTDHPPATMESRWKRVSNELQYRALFDDAAFRGVASDFLEHYSSEPLEEARKALFG